jgi:hypothetical protein
MSRKTNVNLRHMFQLHEASGDLAYIFVIVYSLCIQQFEPKDDLEIKTEHSLSRIYKSLLNDQAIARQGCAQFSSGLRSNDYHHEGIEFTE